MIAKTGFMVKKYNDPAMMPRRSHFSIKQMMGKCKGITSTGKFYVALICLMQKIAREIVAFLRVQIPQKTAYPANLRLHLPVFPVISLTILVDML